MKTVRKILPLSFASALVLALGLTSANAGELTRVRGEANSLLHTAKALNERICYLDANGNSAAIAARLESAVYAVKELIYADASIYEVDVLVNDITGLNDSLVRSLEYNYTLSKDRRITREIERFQDRFVYLRKDLDRARKHILKRQPVIINNPVRSCVNAPASNRYSYGNRGYYAPGRTIDPGFYGRPSDQYLPSPYSNTRQNFGSPVRSIDNRRPVDPRFQQPKLGPQIRVSTPNVDLKTDLMRFVLSRIGN